MPQVDLEAFVSSDRKITCESTLADDPLTRPYNSAVSLSDFPPESYFLSKDEWLSNNTFFDRKESHRGNSANSNSNYNSNPSSQRFLLKSNVPIISLPKPQRTCYNEVKQRRNRVILKRVGSRTKTDISLLEPSSPKVSCIGKVRSKRERSQRMHRQKSGRPDPFKEKSNRIKKTGLLASFRNIFRRRRRKDASERGSYTLPSMSHDIMSRLPPEDSSSFDAGIGGMKRFVSGRRDDLLLTQTNVMLSVEPS